MFGEAIRVWAAGTIHKTKHVTTAGPYARIRHPLYFGSFFVALGYCCMSGHWSSFLVIMPLFFLFHGAAVWMEERTLSQVFGEEYRRYMRQVGRAFPRLRPFNEQRGGVPVEPGRLESRARPRHAHAGDGRLVWAAVSPRLNH